jgi:succinoglycan biosynthesis protein ExoL
MSKLSRAAELSFKKDVAPRAPIRPLVAFFGHDSNEPTVIKRMSAFAAAGARVVAFTFTRDRGAEPASRFENVHLGFTRDRNYLRRLPGLIWGLLVALGKVRTLRRANVIYARNIDMALIAVFAKLLSGSRAILAYEVLDIQRVFFGDRPINKFVRSAERLILAASNMLIVSSPDFMDNYFKARQKYSGPWRLLENKVAAGQWLFEAIAVNLPSAPPWVIGWFGRLRCRKSLEILCRIADRLGDKVFIDIRGLPSAEDLPTAVIEGTVASRPNMLYGGAYSNPEDLARIYGAVHFSWCMDFLDARTNSDWLLPNRIYEGGLFAVPALARAGTATARKVEADGLGFSFEEPLGDSVGAFLRQLQFAEYVDVRERIRNLRRSKFVDSSDTRELLYGLLGVRYRQKM